MTKKEEPSQEEIDRITSEILMESLVKAHEVLFESIRTAVPEQAKLLEGDYREWMDATIAAAKEMPGGNFRNSDIEKILPNNQWGPLVKSLLLRYYRRNPETRETDEEEAKREMANAIINRFLRKDVQ